MFALFTSVQWQVLVNVAIKSVELHDKSRNYKLIKNSTPWSRLCIIFFVLHAFLKLASYCFKCNSACFRFHATLLKDYYN
jgi:hypothetical protein